MHEWEARVRNIERNVNDIWEVLRRLEEKVGKAVQDMQMMRPDPGSGRPVSVQFAVVTTTITAAPGADTAGQGVVTLRKLDGSALANGKTGVTVYSNFTSAVASGDRVMVAMRGDVAYLLSADCP